MANPTMSDDATLHFDTAVFNPELNEMHVGRNPVFHTSCTLVPVDFANSKFADDYVESLDEVAKVLKHGFETNETSTQINKTQWLASVAQVLAAIHKGVYCTFPLLSTEEYKAAFGPDDSNATRDFSFAVGSLHYFLTNMAVDHPNNYKQCARCLKVSSTTTTAEHFEAHLMACNRDADAVRLMVINTMIKKACNEALRWKDVQDQIVLVVINSDPPPFHTDLRIEEWVQRMATSKHLEAKANATAFTVKTVHATYKAQLAISTASLDTGL